MDILKNVEHRSIQEFSTPIDESIRLCLELSEWKRIMPSVDQAADIHYRSLSNNYENYFQLKPVMQSLKKEIEKELLKKANTRAMNATLAKGKASAQAIEDALNRIGSYLDHHDLGALQAIAKLYQIRKNAEIKDKKFRPTQNWVEVHKETARTQDLYIKGSLAIEDVITMILKEIDTNSELTEEHTATLNTELTDLEIHVMLNPTH